jgi:uncharacterized metal-binding protein YceD (DUF177 family)|tara:strand:+ start:4736 stop:5257 length:522 start_codon:yes stop_codon:yes gene_type:complete
MGGLNPFVIKFAGLKEGSHKFNFKIDTKFFEGFDYFDFKSAELETKLELEKQETILNLMLKTKGDILVPCDLSMENFKMPVLTNFSLTIKFGEIYCDESDEILILPHGSHQIDISQYIYEMVVLSVPLKKIHPGIKDGSLNSDILERLKLLQPKEKETPSEYDSRWDKLKDLL